MKLADYINDNLSVKASPAARSRRVAPSIFQNLLSGSDMAFPEKMFPY